MGRGVSVQTLTEQRTGLWLFRIFLYFFENFFKHPFLFFYDGHINYSLQECYNRKGGPVMNIDFTMLFNMIRTLLVMIFRKFEVDKEFEALGIDVIGMLSGTNPPQE